jgi:hypothetical protein
LIDERAGSAIARGLGLPVTGTLGVLVRVAIAIAARSPMSKDIQRGSSRSAELAVRTSTHCGKSAAQARTIGGRIRRKEFGTNFRRDDNSAVQSGKNPGEFNPGEVVQRTRVRNNQHLGTGNVPMDLALSLEIVPVVRQLDAMFF